MKKSSLLLSSSALAFAAAGCFGSDPNKNSQYANRPDASGGGGTMSGSIDPTKPITGTALATFDMNGQSFGLEAFHDTNAINLADPAVGAMPTLRHEPGDGSPANGALRVVAPYDSARGPRQYVELQSPTFGTNLQDWSGGKLHVRVKIAEGSFTGGAQLFVKTTSAYVFGGSWIDYPAGSGWKEFTLDLETPVTANPGYDPGQVISYGVQLNTGDDVAGDGPTTFIVDSFSIERPTGGGAGGADGGGAGGADGGGAGGSAGADAAADGGGAAGSDGSTD